MSLRKEQLPKEFACTAGSYVQQMASMPPDVQRYADQVWADLTDSLEFTKNCNGGPITCTGK